MPERADTDESGPSWNATRQFDGGRVLWIRLRDQKDMEFLNYGLAPIVYSYVDASNVRCAARCCYYPPADLLLLRYYYSLFHAHSCPTPHY